MDAHFLLLSVHRSRLKTVHERIPLAGLSKLPSVPQIAKVKAKIEGREGGFLYPLQASSGEGMQVLLWEPEGYFVLCLDGVRRFLAAASIFPTWLQVILAPEAALGTAYSTEETGGVGRAGHS